MWHLQFHDVYAKTLLSTLSFLIDKPPFVFFSFDRQVDSIISQTEDFSHRLTYTKTTRLSRGFSFTIGPKSIASLRFSSFL